jgi:hypothetical protein
MMNGRNGAMAVDNRLNLKVRLQYKSHRSGTLSEGLQWVVSRLLAVTNITRG